MNLFRGRRRRNQQWIRSCEPGPIQVPTGNNLINVPDHRPQPTTEQWREAIRGNQVELPLREIKGKAGGFPLAAVKE